MNHQFNGVLLTDGDIYSSYGLEGYMPDTHRALLRTMLFYELQNRVEIDLQKNGCPPELKIVETYLRNRIKELSVNAPLAQR